jgi:hypothetical protein
VKASLPASRRPGSTADVDCWTSRPVRGAAQPCELHGRRHEVMGAAGRAVLRHASGRRAAGARLPGSVDGCRVGADEVQGLRLRSGAARRRPVSGMVLSDHVESIDGMERRAELAGEAEPARHRVLLDPLDLRGTMRRRPTSRSPDRRATMTEGHPLSSSHPVTEDPYTEGHGDIRRRPAQRPSRVSGAPIGSAGLALR